MAACCRVSTRKGLFTLVRGAQGWSVRDSHFLGDNCTLSFQDPRNGNLFAALNHGHFGVKVHRSTDHGNTWQEIAAPQYPPKPADYVPKVPLEGKAADWSLKLIWSFAAAGDTLWCGTLPGGLFSSTDNGDTWQLNRPLWDHPLREEWMGGGADDPGIHSICVDPRDSQVVRLAVSTGGIWETRDGGAFWSLIGQGLRAEYMPLERAHEPIVQDVHLMVQCGGQPDCFWLQHHNGIFRSTDAARSWMELTNVAPSAFGFAVAVHPTDPQTAWFIPAVKDEKRYPAEGRLVVTRTRDGGASFETLTAGLPQEHAYDLVYRHALALDADGTTLAFGSTTGSLWISENAGDSWTLINAHLPPIYAVDFHA
jgi:photosystem II stability/assembly factor-like uncharacterized protein